MEEEEKKKYISDLGCRPPGQQSFLKSNEKKHDFEQFESLSAFFLWLFGLREFSCTTGMYYITDFALHAVRVVERG